MSRGNISRRGRNSWRLKFDVGVDSFGRRNTRYVTVKGKRQDAEKELTRLLGQADAGTLPEPSKMTVKECIDAWLNGAHGLAPKTVERYRQLAVQQIYPHLGASLLQKLRPAEIQEWHGILLKFGGKDGKPLSAQTVTHVHRVLHRALQRGVANETLARNAASVISPPKVEKEEIEILNDGQVAEALRKLKDHALSSIAAIGLSTGMRRGELLALRWSDCDLESATVRIERSLEETKEGGLRFKMPKNKRSRRTISLPPSAVTVLREHRGKQLEQRLALGLGKHELHALVFCKSDQSPMSPDNLSRDWGRACKTLGLPKVMFHALRHTHVSALIASGVDVVTVSRRIGHSSPTVTLNTYGHLFKNTDTAAADAIEAALRMAREL